MTNKLGELLSILGRDPASPCSVCSQDPRVPGSFAAHITTVSDAPAKADALASAGLNVWFGVQPLREGIGPGSRGTARDVTGLTSLYADLDFATDMKPGGLSPAVCHAIVDDLSEIVGVRPACIVASGHGLQPYWPLETALDVLDGTLLMLRWKALCIKVAAAHGGAIDKGVFELARILRIPGPPNVKNPDRPAPTGLVVDSGKPLNLTELAVALDSYVPVEGLAREAREASANRAAHYAAAAGDEDTCGQIKARADEAILGARRELKDEPSAHDAVRTRVLGIVNFMNSGHLGGEAALNVISEEFVAVIGHPETGRLSAREAQNEFDKMVSWAWAQQEPDERSNNPFAQVEGMVRIPQGCCRAVPAQVHHDPSDDTAADFEEAVKAQIRGPEDQGNEVGSSWSPVDLGPYLDGEIDLSRKAIVLRMGKEGDGFGLFYPGRVNGIIGESETGKTWVALHAVHQELADGKLVIYLDFENTAKGIVERLLSLGCSKERVRSGLTYIAPTSMMTTEDLASLAIQVGRRPTLIVVDGFNAAMGVFEWDLMSNKDCTKFVDRFLKPLCITGAAVVYVDHVTKSHTGVRAAGGIGAQAKRAATTGCAILADLVPAARLRKGKLGHLVLSVDKDRDSDIREIANNAGKVGVFNLDATAKNGSLVAWISAPKKEEEEPTEEKKFQVDAEKRMEIARSMVKFLRNGESASANALEKADSIPGPREMARDVRKKLVVAGFLKEEAGANRAVMYSIVRGRVLFKEDEPTFDGESSTTAVAQNEPAIG